MTSDQAAIIGILVATVAMFVWGRWRHDMVAFGALLASVGVGLVPAADAFAGFAHPAVITVASVLILSRGLQTSGAVEFLARWVIPGSAGPLLATASLTGLAAVLSAFMNNVGALALLMPLAIQMAARRDVPAGKVLMPLAFGSILGGMTTLIGTPPNLIVSGFRAATGGSPFGMFDFTAVGLAVAATGLLFLLGIGWRLVPTRQGAGANGFETGAYRTEARVPEGSKAAGMRLREIEESLAEADAQVIGLVRNEVRLTPPSPYRTVLANDILVIEANPEALAAALSRLNLTLSEAPQAEEAAEIEEVTKPESNSAPDVPEEKEDTSPSDEVVLMELAVLPYSNLIGRSATEVGLRSRYRINLLAISRQGRRSAARLRQTAIAAGDLLLVQGASEIISEFAADFGCVPLAERPLHFPDRRKALTATGIMGLAIAAAAFGLVHAAIAFTAGVLVSMALGVVSPRRVYDAVDWPVIVLLGALIPVAGAMAMTGAADLLAELLLEWVTQGHAVAALASILVLTMFLSDFMNNAATAAVMCPIAIGAAARLDASADPFLMAVAVGASCAFLTPIGHQNNTLILGPGGFRFGDYWRLGLPLEVLVVLVGVPMILLAWPLGR